MSSRVEARQLVGLPADPAGVDGLESLDGVDRLGHPGAGERRIATLDGTAVPFVFCAARQRDAPLVIAMAGIASRKEPWAEPWGELLRVAPRIGCAVAIADFPGVGANALRYTRGAARLFGAIMEATRDASNSGKTLIVAPGFGGHLAMIHSLGDARIRGIVTIGAPLARFFTDPKVSAAMPATLRAALCHACGVDDAMLARHLTRLALRAEDITRLPPVVYVASLRDEIIPSRDWKDAARLTRDLQVYAFDDVHGAPRHLREIGLIVLRALCHHAGRARVARWVERAGRWALDIAPLALPRPRPYVV